MSGQILFDDPTLIFYNLKSMLRGDVMKRSYSYVYSLVVVLVAAILWLTGCRPPPPPAPSVPVRLAIPMQPSSALMLIARELGYFEHEGLAPAYLFFPSGKRAMEDGILTGLADLGSCSDLPVAESLLAERDFVILTAIQLVRSVNKIVARRDAGIATIADLTGRRVGVQPLSAVHYFLDRILQSEGLDISHVTTVFMPIQELVPALLSGDIDAISIREPFISEAVHRLGTNSITFAKPWVYPQFDLLVARTNFADENPEALDRIMRALIRAERFIAEHPQAARDALAHALMISPATATHILENTVNHVMIPHSLIVVLEEQMKWINRLEGRPEAGIVNLMPFFRTAALQNLTPGLVSEALIPGTWP